MNPRFAGRRKLRVSRDLKAGAAIDSYFPYGLYCTLKT